MGEVQVATVTELRGKMKLTYTPDVAPLGTPLISVTMPVSAADYHDKVVRPFFCGLLPEGPARQTIAYDFGVDANDDVGLLTALGRDCAGAFMVLPAGEPTQVAPEPAVRLDVAEIERRLRSLPVYPLGVSDKVRASLPGVQPKLLLARRDGDWFSPGANQPSTHILKPAIPELSASVANEVYCMNLAARVGLDAARTSLERFGSVEVLVSERYDRRVLPGGTTVRVHQEDACQALSVLTRLPKHKYQAHGGPSLQAIARILTAWNGSVRDLLRYATFSVAVGNADLHGKNISMLHRPDGTVALAPIYDVMCTTHYDGAADSKAVDTELAMFIGAKTDILTVAFDDLVTEAKRWGMRPVTARSAIGETLERVLAEVDHARSEINIDVPAAIIDRIRTRAISLAAREHPSGR